MEMAKVTSKGQITIPVSIRRRLGINEGDKLLFIDRPEGVMMLNPDMLPGGQAEAPEKREMAPRRKASADAKAQDDSPPAEQPPSEPEAAPAPKEKPAPQIQGVDLNALLNEIRSIGSNI